MSEPYENFQKLFTVRAENFGNDEQFVLDTRDLDLPVHIKWNFLGIVSFLLSHPLDENTEAILDQLLAMGKRVNNEMGNVPALTALALQSQDQNQAPVISRMTKKLLEKQADPLFISRKTCRSKYTVPDALGMAAFSRCVPMLRQLLAYWWPSPIYVLDSWTGHMPQQFKFLFPILMQYGWPHGTPICEDVEYFIDSVIERNIEDDMTEWKNFKVLMRSQPSSLKKLCRIVIRKTIGLGKQNGHEYYQCIEKLDNLPTALISFLLLKEP
ncbi:uncharacterized protein LOC132198858 [Neocloeon triangulifer]|uniref:uncharacterized protein LOC132198858 n=1 Tax=Neocloeon triangulifer TaxID=2078957 RepID=UPI00286F4DE2|nr:uncharacterized protein LOC132198858 [Neocloeon triangulifer]